MNGLSTHLSDEFIRIFIRKHLIVFWQSIQNIQIIFFCKKVAVILTFIGSDTSLNNHESFVINNGLQFFGAHSQKISNFIRQRLEIPDMNNRNNQFDMSHSFATNFLFSDFNTATITHDTLITNTLVLSASTLVIFYWSKNSFAKQTVSFGLVCTIVDRFGFNYFPVASFEYTVRRSQANGNFGKCSSRAVFFFECHIIFR